MHWQTILLAVIGLGSGVAVLFGFSACILSGQCSRWEEENLPPSAPAIHEDAIVRAPRFLRGVSGNSHQRRTQRRAAERAKLTVA